jgi:hypothetical protein
MDLLTEEEILQHELLIEAEEQRGKLAQSPEAEKEARRRIENMRSELARHEETREKDRWE